MDISLYKSKRFDDLNSSNKLLNMIDRLTEDEINILRIAFKKYEHIDDISFLFNRDLFKNDLVVYDKNEDKYIVIYYKNEDNKSNYIWEYYSNWIKIRNSYDR